MHPLNTLMKKGYQGILRYALAPWSDFYRFFDQPKLFRRQIGSLIKLRNGLAALLEQEQPEQPDVVVSTYPVYVNYARSIG